MIDPWLKLTLLLSVAAVVGFLAQRTGLCMIRGVMEFRAGRPTLLLAMLFCGVCIWAFVPLAGYWQIDIPHVRHQWHVLFMLGGLIFGLGTAANGGCSVSTMSRLARGDLHMLATISGWIVGWCVWVAVSPDNDHIVSLGPTPALYIAVEVVAWVAVTLWALKSSAANRKLWLVIMSIGLLSGSLFVLQPNWSPSDMVQHLANALLHGQTNVLPGMERYLIVLALLLGMLVAAWVGHSFSLRRISLKLMVMHLLAGTAMGVGASIVMGGNDLQLLLALPSASPAALVTVVSMLTGIYLGVLLRQPLHYIRKRLGVD